MPLTDNQHRFGMQLAQMSRGWRAELDRRLAGLNLSQARWLVLLHLARFPDAPTQRELAQSVGVEGPTWRVCSIAWRPRGLCAARQCWKTGGRRRSCCAPGQAAD